MPYLIVSVILQLGLVVHCMKTGRNTYWIYLLLFFPVIGGLAYLIVELLPDLTQSRTGRAMQRNASKAINPNREIREAAQNLRVSDSLQNVLRMAEQLLERNAFSEANELLESHNNGLNREDPVFLHLLAQSLFGLGAFERTITALDDLKAANPDAASAEAHLLYARALENLQRFDEAIHEYEALIGYYSGPEAACRFALLLESRDEYSRANTLWSGVIDDAEISGKHFQRSNRDWIKMAREHHRG